MDPTISCASAKYKCRDGVILITAVPPTPRLWAWLRKGAPDICLVVSELIFHPALWSIRSNLPHLPKAKLPKCSHSSPDWRTAPLSRLSSQGASAEACPARSLLWVPPV